jgi:signal transduction histidine kinase/ActR/RegA family two-component response regulator
MDRKRRLREFAGALGGLFAAVFAVVLIVWINIDRMVSVDAGDRKAREVLAQADTVEAAFLKEEAGLRGYVAAANGDFLRDIEQGRRQLALALPSLASLTADDPEQRGRAATLTALSGQWMKIIAAPEVALVRSGGQAGAQAMVGGREGERRMAAMLGVLDALRLRENATLAQRADAQAQAFVTARWTLVLGAVGALTVASLVGSRFLWLLVISRDAAERALARAQAADHAKTNFLANVSHEIRTPLNGVAGLAEALSRSGLDAGQGELVETIRRAAAEVDGILADVLTVSRGAADDADPEECETAPFNLTAFVHALLADHRPTAEAKGLALSERLPDAADIWVTGDAPRLRRILASFLSNAVKFTDLGAVRLTLSALADDRYRFEVKDTGIGFDATRKAQLFDGFSQSDSSSTRRHRGAGLGLAVARLAAARLGARIDCDSTPGEGSTFSLELTLPRSAPPASAPALVADTVAEDADQPLRVLIVDDHATNRQVLELILDQVGVDWVSVEDGQQAVEAARAQAFSAILMDIQMPVMDGLAATREIRRLERDAGRQREPVIIVSANCQPEHVRLGAEAGAQRHLKKPVSAQQLLATLSDVLDEQQQAA